MLRFITVLLSSYFVKRSISSFFKRLSARTKTKRLTAHFLLLMRAHFLSKFPYLPTRRMVGNSEFHVGIDPLVGRDRRTCSSCCVFKIAGPSWADTWPFNDHGSHLIPAPSSLKQRQQVPLPAPDRHYLTQRAFHLSTSMKSLLPQRCLDFLDIR